MKDFQNNPFLGKRNDGKIPAGWKFDPNDFSIEEFGRVIEKPDFPLNPGRYMVMWKRSDNPADS